MKPETAHYLAKAREDLADAVAIAAIGLVKVAARSAYYAMFHAAEAYVYERSGKAVKTHSGLRSEFARASIDDPVINRGLIAFLAQSYKYKELADYDIGDAASISRTEVEDVIARASALVSEVEAAIALRSPSQD